MRYLLCIIVFLFSNFYCLEAELKKPTFLIQEEAIASKNVLKEKIGKKVKDSLYTCSSISKNVGEFMQRVSILQKKLFGFIEDLIENDGEFKKAGRTELVQVLHVMKEVESTLDVQNRELKKVKDKINTCNTLREKT